MFLGNVQELIFVEPLESDSKFDYYMGLFIAVDIYRRGSECFVDVIQRSRCNWSLSESIKAATRRGNLLRLEAFSCHGSGLILLGQLEPSERQGTLRVEISPPLPDLSCDWAMELGRIEEAFEAARRRGDPEALQVKDKSLEVIRSRFSERLLEELPQAAYTPLRARFERSSGEVAESWDAAPVR